MNIVSVQLNEESVQPKYLQLFDVLKEMIISNSLGAGERLPAIRDFAKQLNVNTITIINAYKQLETSGYITARKGSGYYVSKDKAGTDKNDSLLSGSAGFAMQSININFASASPHPSIFPIDSFKECINEILERDKGYAFGYQESNGYKPLRQSICSYIKKDYGIRSDEELIQIVSGSQQGLDIIGKVLLNPGDYVITETPTYDGAVASFKSRGARIVGVNLEKDGIDLVDLEKKIRICKPKLIYVMTKYQNPSTVSYSEEKLKGLLELARKYNSFIVEDDSMAELSYHGYANPSIKALDTGDRTIYLKSFSKMLMPGLRMGFLVIPKSLLPEFTKIKQTSDISSSGLIQRSLDLYFRSGKWDEHRKYMVEIYKGKYEFMLNRLEAMRKYGIRFTEPNGGLYFWVSLPKHINSKEVYERCKQRGLLVLPSYIFYENVHRDKETAVRLSFAAVNIDQIKEGMAILEESIRN